VDSLANKYRPKRFCDVVGQDKVVKNLVNSIRKNKLHNAYLFSGKYVLGLLILLI